MKQLFAYLWKNKQWWIVPSILVIAVVSLLLAFTATVPLSPFVYMLF